MKGAGEGRLRKHRVVAVSSNNLENDNAKRKERKKRHQAAISSVVTQKERERGTDD